MKKSTKNALLMLPIASVGIGCLMPVDASEVKPYDLPGTGNRPTDPDPVPPTPVDPTPQPPVEKPEVKPDQPQPPVKKPDPEPEKPLPPVHVPEITTQQDATLSSTPVIIKQSEVNNDNVINLTGMKVVQVTTTFTDGVVTNTTTTNLTPRIVGNVSSNLGVQVVTYSGIGTDKTSTVNINVVSDNATLSQDRGLAMFVDQPSVKITQTQAKEIKSSSDLVKLNQVSGINVNGDTQPIAALNDGDTASISTGKPGIYKINYGILARSGDKFMVSGEIEVTQDNTSIVDSVVGDLADASQIKGQTGNTAEQTNAQSNSQLIQQGGSYTPRTGVNTQNMMFYTTLGLIASCLLFINLKRNK